MSEAVLEDRKFVKCRVRITMTPIEFTDVYWKKPTRDTILEGLVDCLGRKELEEHFEVEISEKGSKRNKHGC